MEVLTFNWQTEKNLSQATSQVSEFILHSEVGGNWTVSIWWIKKEEIYLDFYQKNQLGSEM